MGTAARPLSPAAVPINRQHGESRGRSLCLTCLPGAVGGPLLVLGQRVTVPRAGGVYYLPDRGAGGRRGARDRGQNLVRCGRSGGLDRPPAAVPVFGQRLPAGGSP